MAIVEIYCDGVNTFFFFYLQTFRSRSHFVPDYFSLAPSDDIDQDTLLDSTLGLIFKLIRAYVSHWKALPNASKLCLLAWGADIFQAVQPHSKYSGTKAWTTLRYSLSSNLHQLIAIAGKERSLLNLYKHAFTIENEHVLNKKHLDFWMTRSGRGRDDSRCDCRCF